MAVTLAWAEVTALCRLAESIVARIAPALTWSPAATGSEVTVPLTVKDRSARCAGAMVPEAETVSRMVLLVALTSVGAAVLDEEERVAAQAPPPPTMTNAVTAAMMM